MNYIKIYESGDFIINFDAQMKRHELRHKCGFSWRLKYPAGAPFLNCSCTYPLEIPEDIDVIYRMLKDGE
jgi:hypothetical protein